MTQNNTNTNQSADKDKVFDFAKDFARSKMPKYDSEWLTVAFKPSPDLDDEISKLSWGHGLFMQIPKDTFCRQFVFADGKYQDRTIEEIKAGNPKTDSKKILFLYPSGPNCYTMDYDGASLDDEGNGKKSVTGQGWQIDVEWDGDKFTPLPQTNHMTLIT